MTTVTRPAIIDPVCGMPVRLPAEATLNHGGRVVTFCSEFCKRQFERHPGAYEVVDVEPARTIEWAERRVAYFSMEVALSSRFPTYSGGLGVLAGDTLRSCADLEVPSVAVSLVHRKGYFRQDLSAGYQREREATWRPEEVLRALPCRVTVQLEGREVVVRAWEYTITGSSGYTVPLILLDTDVPENSAEDRALTDQLYGGDSRYRLMQEAILGLGGARMLVALGCTGLATYHLNEGHAALAPLEVLRADADRKRSATAGAPLGDWDFASIRRRTVFTTHTPVPAGHDRFDVQLARRVLGDAVPAAILEMLGGSDCLDMTRLALNVSHFVNGVALRHREVSSQMFPEYEIHQITNGVHSLTWTSAPFRALYDRHIPGWRNDPLMLHNALALPDDEVWAAHQVAKAELMSQISARAGRNLRRDVLTLGFARRATAYKRPELILTDMERLRDIARKRPLQIVFAGKAHPRDEPGKERIRLLMAASERLGETLPIVYLEEYDLELAAAVVAGVDVWLNTPRPPLEASGTSGMKAAHNGVPSLSVLDGWWHEGHIEGVTGWSIGAPAANSDDGADANELYRKLEAAVTPAFYDDRHGWTKMMRSAIALNASFFNTHRMVHQYRLHAYGLAE